MKLVYTTFDNNLFRWELEDGQTTYQQGYVYRGGGVWEPWHDPEGYILGPPVPESDVAEVMRRFD